MTGPLLDLRILGACLPLGVYVGAVCDACATCAEVRFMSRALENWAFARGVQLDFIRPGKPVENAFIESFNGRRATSA